MKYATLALMGIGLAFSLSIATGQTQTPKGETSTPKGEAEPKTVEQKYAYAVGLDLGRRMKAQGVELEADMIAKGIKDALANKPGLTEQQMAEVQKAFVQLMEAKQEELAASKVGPAGEKNLKDGQAFLAANGKKPGVTTTSSGLQYKILKSGPASGKTPKPTDMVSANYRGTLIDGTEFDSSKSGPVDFPVDGVIKGWIEVLQLMKVGDKWQVFIPSNLAYGPRQKGPIITPNSVLIFEMELVAVK